ncbi:hypothetical protein, partial [Thiolapillus sp.]|uniref:hypothetical protein n=1 Tax=Thiolapillus sp. TaxID=2017437 RepID=UPI003AF6B4C6
RDEDFFFPVGVLVFRAVGHCRILLWLCHNRWNGDDVVRNIQACLRPRDRFWDIPVPKIDSAFDNLFVPQPSWSPSTTQQLRKLVAAPYLAPNDWTPRSEAYFVFPLAQGTPGKQCGLAATGDYQPSLRSPWLAAVAFPVMGFGNNIILRLVVLWLLAGSSAWASQAVDCGLTHP